jgi:hypothetical protein
MKEEAMANGGSRISVAIMTLIIGAAAGYWLGSKKGAEQDAATKDPQIASLTTKVSALTKQVTDLNAQLAAQGIRWGLTVGPEPRQISVDPLAISKSHGDTVQWWAMPSTKYLYIEFEQRVFENALPINGRYRVLCSSSHCDSGAIAANPPPPPDANGYKYWQGIADSPATPAKYADGHIIINP